MEEWLMSYWGLCHKLWQKYVAVGVVKGLFQDHGYGGHFYGQANCMSLKGSQGSILYYPMAIMNVEYFSFVCSHGFTWEFVISTNGLCLGWQIDKLSFIKPTQWVEIWPHNSQTSMVRTHCCLLLCVVWSAAIFPKNSLPKDCPNFSRMRLTDQNANQTINKACRVFVLGVCRSNFLKTKHPLHLYWLSKVTC